MNVRGPCLKRPWLKAFVNAAVLTSFKVARSDHISKRVHEVTVPRRCIFLVQSENLPLMFSAGRLHVGKKTVCRVVFLSFRIVPSVQHYLRAWFWYDLTAHVTGFFARQATTPSWTVLFFTKSFNATVLTFYDVERGNSTWWAVLLFTQ
jgi:hypothetical protein